jgi:hypothetical protein
MTHDPGLTDNENADEEPRGITRGDINLYVRRAKWAILGTIVLIPVSIALQLLFYPSDWPKLTINAPASDVTGGPRPNDDGPKEVIKGGSQLLVDFLAANKLDFPKRLFDRLDRADLITSSFCLFFDFHPSLVNDKTFLDTICAMYLKNEPPIDSTSDLQLMNKLDRLRESMGHNSSVRDANPLEPSCYLSAVDNPRDPVEGIVRGGGSAHFVPDKICYQEYHQGR